MFAKIFSQIFDSSIASNLELRHFFMDMLLLADINGVVNMTPDSIAARTRMPLEMVKRLLAELEMPDPESATPDHEGRRIVRIDSHRSWGWEIVNYTKYRQYASDEQRREKTRLRLLKFRSKYQQKAVCNAPETHGNACNAMQKQKQKHIKTLPAATADGDGEHKAFIQGWVENFKAQFGHDYVFDGGRDAKAVKELLKTGILRIDLLEIAKKAWPLQNCFACRMASTIHGFNDKLNQIRIDIKYATTKNGNRVSEKRIDRSIGTANEGIASQYGEFAARQRAGVGGVDEV